MIYFWKPIERVLRPVNWYVTQAYYARPEWGPILESSWFKFYYRIYCKSLKDKDLDAQIKAAEQRAEVP